MRFRIRTCFLSASLFVLPVVPAPLVAQEAHQQPAAQPQHYTVIDLGTLGGSYSEAFYMNNRAAIGGVSSRVDGTEHAFLWQKGVMADLGTLGGPNSEAFGGPNLSNQLVGQSDTADVDPDNENFCGFGTHQMCRPFLWQPLPSKEGVMFPLATLGGHNGQADGVNNRGEVVGTAENATADTSCPIGQSLHQFKPVVWRQGGIRELRTFSGDPDGVAFGTNDNGDVVGTSGVCAPFNPNTSENLTARHALLWHKGEMTDLGNLGGTGSNGGILAFSVNDRGHVVGVSDITGDASFHAFLWTRESGMEDLGTLEADDFGSSATGLDDQGNVVGLSVDASGTPHAFLRPKGGKMIDLNTLIPADSPLFLFQACSINSRGELTGLALDTSTGELHAFFANPVDSDSGHDDDTADGQAGTRERKHVALSESVRKQLQQRLRFHLPEAKPPVAP
jgi:probable HAF family extracellular repeat protein